MIIFSNHLFHQFSNAIIIIPLFHDRAQRRRKWLKNCILLRFMLSAAHITPHRISSFVFHPEKFKLKYISSICITKNIGQEGDEARRVHILVLNVFSQESKMNVPEEICKSSFFLTTPTQRNPVFCLCLLFVIISRVHSHHKLEKKAHNKL